MLFVTMCFQAWLHFACDYLEWKCSPDRDVTRVSPAHYLIEEEAKEQIDEDDDDDDDDDEDGNDDYNNKDDYNN